MVAIVVYFESIHRAAAMDAEAMPPALGEAMRSEDMTAIEELRLRYEQGLDLLLNAADLEQSCVAIFNEFAPISVAALEQALGPSLLKKFKQLELYEVPCYACVDKDDREDSTALSSTVEHSATEQVFAFVQTVGFNTELEIFNEENVKTFTM